MPTTHSVCRSHSRPLCDIGVGCCFLLVAGVVRLYGGEAHLNPVADAFVSASQPARNFGAAGALSVAAPGLSRGGFESVLRFDSSSARDGFDALWGPNQWTVDRVSLELTAASPLNAIFNASTAGRFSVTWMRDDSWAEGFGSPNIPSTGGITSAALPSFLSDDDRSLGSYSFDGATSGRRSYDLLVESSLRADLLAGELVSLRLSPADASVSYLFNSRNYINPADHPALTITAIPEPGAGILVSLLCICMVAKRQRRKLAS